MKKLPWISILIQTWLGGTIALFIFATIVIYIGGDLKKAERCEAFCNCSINNSCSYTFDYDDVKDCNCTLGE